MRLILLFCLMAPAIAESACREVPAPGVPHRLRQSVAYSLAFQAGYDVIPHNGQGQQIGQDQAVDTICFDGVTDLSWLTDATMGAEHTQQEAGRQAATIADQNRIEALRNQIKGQLQLNDEDFADAFPHLQ